MASKKKKAAEGEPPRQDDPQLAGMIRAAIAKAVERGAKAQIIDHLAEALRYAEANGSAV
jgi:hypothetical protein